MNVMINFLEEKYGTKASCSHVNQDGYEVENLISKQCNNLGFSRQNGFLVEHFIKPPVDVNFSFPFPIQISSIELGLSVGAQTTDGIEILVTDLPEDHGSFRVVYHQCPLSMTYLNVCNASFKTRPPFCENAEDTKMPRNDTKSHFKFSHLLNNVRTVRVRIIKTLGSSVPGLGSVKIFGIPGRNCQPTEFENVLQLYRRKAVDCSEDDDIQILSSPGNSRIERNDSFQVHIPEEFLDPLTCEVMALPMLLPSGHSVDQSTLDKFSSSQASWGRLPCDPFTGIPFGPDRKPVSNGPLKARIDAFLFKNASLDLRLSRVPRTLGKRHVENPRNESSNSASAYVPITAVNSSEFVSPPLVLDYNSSPRTSHEKALQDSLDLALNSYYRIPGLSRNSLKEKDVCVACKDSNASSRYKLPCEHSMCRNCLLNSQNLCPRCQKSFLKEQVHRTYNIP